MSNLLETSLRQMGLPTICTELAKLDRQEAGANDDHQQFLLRLAVVVTARVSNELQARIRAPSIPLCRMLPSKRSWNWRAATSTTTSV